MEEMKIVIPGEVICKKNNLAAIPIGGRCRVIPMTKYTKYEKEAVRTIINCGHKPWTGISPVIVDTFFYLKTMLKFDFDNMQATVNDVLVKANIVIDDDMVHVIPAIKDHGWEKDKDDPRVEIWIKELNV